MKKITVGVYDYYWNSKKEKLYFDEAGKKPVPLAYFSYQQYGVFLKEINKENTKHTSHTSGEWKAERSTDNQRWQVSNGRLILVQHTFDGKEAEANARLMAASPKLLDAALNLLKNTEYQDGEGTILTQDAEELEQAIELATNVSMTALYKQ